MPGYNVFVSRSASFVVLVCVLRLRIELKKELLSNATPQNTKSCTKFAFIYVFDGKSHSNFTRQPFY